MNKKNKIKLLLAIFIMLSIFKFFTAKVGLLGDPSTLLVIKSNPTLSNSFIMSGEDNQVSRGKYEGTWYYEGKYNVITGDEMGSPVESVYDLLIIAWWISVIGLLIYYAFIKIKPMTKQIC